MYPPKGPAVPTGSAPPWPDFPSGREGSQRCAALLSPPWEGGPSSSRPREPCGDAPASGGGPQSALQSCVGALVAQRTRGSASPLRSPAARLGPPLPGRQVPVPLLPRDSWENSRAAMAPSSLQSPVVSARPSPPWLTCGRCGGGDGGSTPRPFPWEGPKAFRRPPALAAHLDGLFFLTVAVSPLPFACVGRDPWSAAGLPVIRPFFYRLGDWHEAVQPFSVTVSDLCKATMPTKKIKIFLYKLSL